jgi:hypothetical protein
VTDYAYRLFRRLKGETAPLPDYFVDAQMLAPADHLTMQAAVQQYTSTPRSPKPSTAGGYLLRRLQGRVSAGL